MKYNPKISQAALLNYARLSYEIGNPDEQVPTDNHSFSRKLPQCGGKRRNDCFVIGFIYQ